MREYLASQRSDQLTECFVYPVKPAQFRERVKKACGASSAAEYGILLKCSSVYVHLSHCGAGEAK